MSYERPVILLTKQESAGVHATVTLYKGYSTFIKYGCYQHLNAFNIFHKNVHSATLGLLQTDEQMDSAKLTDTLWQLLVVLKKSKGVHTIKVKSANYQGKT
jgi:hypothetical protein